MIKNFRAISTGTVDSACSSHQPLKWQSSRWLIDWIVSCFAEEEIDVVSLGEVLRVSPSSASSGKSCHVTSLQPAHQPMAVNAPIRLKLKGKPKLLPTRKWHPVCLFGLLGYCCGCGPMCCPVWSAPPSCRHRKPISTRFHFRLPSQNNNNNRNEFNPHQKMENLSLISYLKKKINK